MAKIPVPFLKGSPREGRPTRWYWQPSAALAKAGWKSIPLGTDIKQAQKLAEAQNEKVETWRNNGAAPQGVRKHHAAGTVAQMIARFKAEHVAKKKPNTQREYNSKLKKLEEWAGRERAIHVTDRSVKALIRVLMKPGPDGLVKHDRAAGIVRVGRTLFKFGEDEGFIPKGSNPFVNPGMPAPPPRQQIWAPEAVDTFCAEAIAMGYESIALAVHLAREIGQREGDLLSLSIRQWVEIPRHKLGGDLWDAIAEPGLDGRPTVMGIRLRQHKTVRWIEVPVVGETRRMVETAIARAMAAGCTTILLEEGRSQSPEWNYWRRQNGDDRRITTSWDPTRFQRTVAEIRARCVEKAMPLLLAAADRVGTPSAAIACELAQLLKLPVDAVLRISARAFVPCKRDGRARKADFMGIRIGETITPVSPELRQRIETMRVTPNIGHSSAGDAPLLVDERTGHGWQDDHFSEQLEDLRHASAAYGIDFLDLQFRDLRRTAVVWLGELGIEDHLIAAITGHKLDTTRKILETYMPRTTKMAARAIVYRLERTAKPDEDREKSA